MNHYTSKRYSACVLNGNKYTRPFVLSWEDTLRNALAIIREDLPIRWSEAMMPLGQGTPNLHSLKIRFSYVLQQLIRTTTTDGCVINSPSDIFVDSCVGQQTTANNATIFEKYGRHFGRRGTVNGSPLFRLIIIKDLVWKTRPSSPQISRFAVQVRSVWLFLSNVGSINPHNRTTRRMPKKKETWKRKTHERRLHLWIRNSRTDCHPTQRGVKAANSPATSKPPLP